MKRTASASTPLMILFALLCLFLTLGLTACGEQDAPAEPTAEESPAQDGQDTREPGETAAESAVESDTGNGQETREPEETAAESVTEPDTGNGQETREPEETAAESVTEPDTGNGSETGEPEETAAESVTEPDTGNGQETREPEETAAESVTEPDTGNEPETGEPEEPAEEGKVYPYTDEEGRTRYLFMLNGKPAYLPHDPYSLPGSKGAFFPLEDVLNILGVSVVKTDDGSSVGSSINGNIFKTTAGQAKMTYGRKTVSASGSAIPTMVDGVLYVPSFFLMQLSNNSIVDFSPDRTYCTLDTDVVIDPANSGPIGITAADLLPDAAKVTTQRSAGDNACRLCFGSGTKIEIYDAKIYHGAAAPTVVQMSRYVPCPGCGGTGQQW